MRYYFSSIPITIGSLILITALSICNIKTVMLSEFEKEMYNNYSLGNGNVELSNSDFDNIKNYISNMKANEYRCFDILLNDGSQGKAYIVSFYGSPEFDHAFGTATIYVNENNEIVGFLDYYDFDSRPWGERAYSAEIISRSIKTFSPRKAKPFKITFGLQAVNPIYDVILEKSFLRIS